MDDSYVTQEEHQRLVEKYSTALEDIHYWKHRCVRLQGAVNAFKSGITVAVGAFNKKVGE